MKPRMERIDATNQHLFESLADAVFDEPIVPERVAAYLAHPGHLMLLAVERQSDGSDLVVGQCAAVLHLHPDKPTELYLDELGTASTHRRKGIARQLMSAMLAWGRELGCEEGWLGTEPVNVAAKTLYDDLFDPGEPIILWYFDTDDC